MKFILTSLVLFSMTIGNGYTKEEKSKEASLPEVSLGSPKAPVVVIDYASLTCHHCAQFHNDVLPEIQKNYIDPGLVRVIIRDYPGDQVSLIAHQIAWSKGEVKYLDLLKYLYSTQDEWLLASDPKAALKKIVAKKGITGEQFDKLLKDKELMDKVVRARLEGKKKYNITATPTIIINAKIYPRTLNFEEFEAIVDPLLKPTIEKVNLKKKS